MQVNLPEGMLVSWYGDDFTGSAAVMEVLSFAGLPSVLFFDTPTDAQLARFPGIRGVGIASTARSHGPDWMRANLPGPMGYLAGLGAPFLHYKICSTLDSAPEVGNIGVAMEIGLAARPSEAVPVIVAAPQMRRYQAFGHLFAGSLQGVFRLDRHPVMARHPVTPMDEADVARHLARQSDLKPGLIDLEALAAPDAAQAALEAALARGERLLPVDAMEAASESAAGRLLWENRGRLGFVVGSQGVEYALIRHWQDAGLLPRVEAPGSCGAVDRIVAVSGSVSPTTAAQIDWSCRNGFEGVRIAPAAFCGTPEDLARGEALAVEAALKVLGQGQSPLVYTAAGPDDPAVAEFRAAVARAGLEVETVNQRIGETLGRVLDRVLRQSGLRRAVISGGDTSGHGARQLGLFALTALAPTIPGAAIFRAHGEGAHDGLELALKGGQMGSADYFGWVREGGGDRRAS